MADEKASTTIKGSGSADGKPLAQTGPDSRSNDHADTTTAKVASTDNIHANVTVVDPRAKRRISFKKLVPLLVLLLAAGILFVISGGWNRFVGGGSKQRTDDAYLRADITPLSAVLNCNRRD